MEGKHPVWKVLAWFVATAIAVSGVWLGYLQYQSGRDADRAEASEASRSAEQQKEENARRLVGEVCARALDVFDSISSLTRSLNAGTAVGRLDMAEFRSQLRDLTEAANRADVPKLSQAASSVRSRFDLLESYVGGNTPPDPAVSQQILEGVFDYMTIFTHCHQEGFPVPSVPPDLVITPSPAVTSPAAPARLGVNIDAPASGGQGAYITAVEPGSPAERAGLRIGDVVVGFAGVLVATPEDLQQAVREHLVGQVVLIAYWREGAFFTVQVTL